MNLMETVDAVAVDQYGLPTVSSSTKRWMKQGMSRFARHCGVARVDEVSVADVAGWVEYERGRAVQAVTVNSFLRSLKTIFGRLEKMGVIAENPARPVPFLKELPASPKAIAREDYLAMREEAGCVRDAAIMDVLWASGCRLGGLLSMRVDRMQHWQGDDGRHCFAFYVTEKFDQPRLVYCGREADEGENLAAYLRERPVGDEPALFLANKLPARKMAASTVEGIVRQCRIAAGIPATRPTHIHSFRHAFALRLLDAGEDLAAVSSWLGHSDPQFTAKVYAIRTEDELRRKYFRTEKGR